MEKYIEGNKAAWEEAFDNRDRICSACKGLGRKRWNWTGFVLFSALWKGRD